MSKTDLQVYCPTCGQTNIDSFEHEFGMFGKYDSVLLDKMSYDDCRCIIKGPRGSWRTTKLIELFKNYKGKKKLYDGRSIINIRYVARQNMILDMYILNSIHDLVGYDKEAVIFIDNWDSIDPRNQAYLNDLWKTVKVLEE